jgi:uncharacterized 2Fe-2S/4Fe-4S cluster protein (DUF4445 family)
MTDHQVRVTFQPHGRSVFVLPGTKVLEAAARAGLTLQTPCGGTGTCGKCRVEFTSGAPEATSADAAVLTAKEQKGGWRLACQAAVVGEAVIHVPESSLFGAGEQILTRTEDGDAEILPAVRKVHVKLPEPTLEDDAPDLLRLERGVGHSFKTDLSLLRRLPGVLRAEGFCGTAVLADHHLIDFEAGDTTEHCYGLAFDIGTTTVVGVLLDLNTGRELAISSGINPQVSFGDDVLSRIKRSTDGAEGLGELHTAVIDAVTGMIRTMCGEAGVECGHIYEIVFAGNTTMEHLLCGVDPRQLGHVPFVPVHARGLLLSAEEMGLPINPNARAYVFPVIGGFVGGDTVSGMLASALGERERPVLMVDIGTNGEIVLAHDGRLWAASTAAGPAFEGARISCGMRAVRGAVEKVVLDEDVHYSVIGNAPATGLCGSGLIDLAAGLLSAGIVESVGRILRPDELPASVPEALRRRVRLDDEGRPEFLLAEDSGASPVVLTQRDIRELQLGAGAIRAGVKILLKQAALSPEDLDCVLIAGGFGSFIRRKPAQRIGLLPGGIDRQRIRYVGNAALNGAKWALLSTQARLAAEDLARRTRHVELSMDTGFQMEFAEAMIFPES